MPPLPPASTTQTHSQTHKKTLSHSLSPALSLIISSFLSLLSPSSFCLSPFVNIFISCRNVCVALHRSPSSPRNGEQPEHDVRLPCDELFCQTTLLGYIYQQNQNECTDHE